MVPKNIADLLTPLALAIWICDDGTWKPGVRIATNCFTKEEVELFCDKKPSDSSAQIKKIQSSKVQNEQKPDAKTIEPMIPIKLEKRKNEVAREIIVEHDSISVTLYDNAEIDGDSITLIYNDSILATHKKLTDKPLTYVIKIAPGSKRNELLMYAENLGSIPPNTALMVIYDGDKRYEVSVRSSLSSNGAVSFKLRE